MASAMAIFLLSIFLSNFFVRETSLESSAQSITKYVERQEADFSDLIQQDSLMNRLIKFEETEEDMLYTFRKPYALFLYNEKDNKQFLRSWNTSTVLPDQNVIYGPEGSTFVKLQNGYYYIIKKKLPKHPDIFAICLILVKYSFFIETDQLRNNFPFNSSLAKKVNISFEKTAYPVNINNKAAFYLKQRPDAQFAFDNAISLILRIVGLFLIFVALYIILSKKFAKRNYLLEIYLFVACLISFRLILYLVKPLFNFGNFSLFDPNIYGTNVILNSLGDLLINAILFCLIIVFIWNRLSVNRQTNVERMPQNKKWAIGGFAVLALVVSTFVIADIIRGIITNSTISFDVTDFFSLDIFSAVGFIILACLCLGFYYFSRIAFKYIFLIFSTKNFTAYILIALCGMAYVAIFADPNQMSFYIPCLIWLLLYSVLFHEEEKINNFFKFTISGLIFWVFVFSFSLSALMLNEIRLAEINKRKAYLENLSTQNDAASERLMSIANTYLDNDFFLDNFTRLHNEQANKVIRDSINSKNYIGYLNKYETRLYIFDSVGNPLFNPGNLSLQSLNTIVKRQSKPTSAPDLYYYETDYDKFAYLNQRNITNDSGKIVGTVFIVSNPKKFSSTDIHPELFKEFSRWNIANSSVYQYAIYNNNVLVNSNNKYPFATVLNSSEVPKTRYEERQNGVYSELWYRASNNKVIVLVRKREQTLMATTLFSYIFCSFLLLISLIHILSLLLTRLSRSRNFNKRLLFFPTIRSQIHVTFIIVTIVSFFIVGVATISFFIDRYNNSNRERLSRTITIMQNELLTHDSLLEKIYELSGKSDTANTSRIDNIVKSVSDIHGVDVNIYDLTGKLRSTSQLDVYSKGVLSTQMSPRAYFYLMRKRRVEQIQTNTISNLTFTSIFSPIRNKEGSFYGFVSIPYFTSQQELRQQISSFLVTIINLNAFIFLVTGLVALLIANRITRSFTVISDKMKMINFSKSNEEIIWESDDEIGELVKEYNKMVIKLEESANTMARDEREYAWREMARQVAHEIKNPLTPMKLSLQYLQKAIIEKRSNVEQLASNVSNNLVEQIDHLAKIAADFSQFANINQTSKEILDLHEVLATLRELYTKNPKVKFNWSPLPHEISVNADRTQMNRLFTNLISNAVEASLADEIAVINIHELIEGNSVIVSVEDKGQGIDNEMRSKIFTPNFTTKTSGTGLGLAMCKSIVTRSGGKIWFDSEEGHGTTFYVQLPLISSSS